MLDISLAKIDGNGMEMKLVDGDLLQQDVEVIVNPWNRNVIPWWLLLPQGVSREIKKHGGTAPFRELSKFGPIPLGNAVMTASGRLSFKAIIHVAGINMFWRASKRSVRDSVKNSLALASDRGFKSIGFPLIGAGSGGLNANAVLAFMTEEVERSDFNGRVHIVRFRPKLADTDRAKLADSD